MAGLTVDNLVGVGLTPEILDELTQVREVPWGAATGSWAKEVLALLQYDPCDFGALGSSPWRWKVEPGPLVVLLGRLGQRLDLGHVQWSSNMDGIFRVDICRGFTPGDYGLVCDHLAVVADGGQVCVEDYVGANGLVGGKLASRDWVSGAAELLAVVGRVLEADLA